MAELGYDGKVAIITGAGGGLGREHALELARRGARVVVNDLGGSVSGEGGDKGPAEHVADEINDLGGEAVPDTNSVATAEGGEAVVKTAVDAFGTVDMTFAIDLPGNAVDFTGTADFTGGKGRYKGIRGRDLKAHDHNTLDGQNGEIELKGFARW